MLKISFTCVDIWKGEEELSNFDFEIIEKNFHYNSSDISKDKIVINKNNLEIFLLIIIINFQLSILMESFI